MTKQEKLDGCLMAAKDLLRDLKCSHKELEQQAGTLLKIIEIIRKDSGETNE